MLKAGDVLVADEQKVRELIEGAVHADVRQAKAAAKKAIEGGDDRVDLVILRVEKVGRATPRRPAFDCDFGDDNAD